MYIFNYLVCMCVYTVYIHTHTHVYIYSQLVNMIKEGCENESALILLIFYFKKYHKNLTFHWIIRILNGGKYNSEINVFLKYMLDTIIGTT